MTAAEVQFGQAAQPGDEGHHAAGGGLVAIQAGDLRPDVAVGARQFQGGLPPDFAAGPYPGSASPGHDGQAELLVLGAGGHRPVHVGVHPGRDPDQDLLPPACAASAASCPASPAESTTTRPTP